MSLDRDNLLNSYEILELPEDASWQEICKSYKNLKELYSTPSIATLSLNEDLLGEQSEGILKAIEQAYCILEGFHREIRIKNEEKIEKIVADSEVFNGFTLRLIRKELNIDLLDISLSTNIQIIHIKNIEDELYDDLPDDVYLKGYLKSYAEYLSLDSRKVIEDYMLCVLSAKEAE